MVKKIDNFSKILNRYTTAERDRIIEAAHWSEGKHRNQKRASGSPYFVHPLEVAEIIVEMRLDPDSVIAALLHDILEDTKVTRQELRKKFGKQVEILVNGVTKISILQAKTKSVQESETIRKMFFAMIKDIRVILIKLADKLHNMRTLQYLPMEKQKNTALECLEIYAPLADRLGISWVKMELEDLSLKHLYPQEYTQIKTNLAEKKEERTEYLKKVEKTIYQEAQREGIQVQISTRAKHFYSIYMKMKRRNKRIDEIYDMMGIRIICANQNECYTMLGIVHRMWIPLENRFKDYIAMPKANKYQSLHTTVMGEGGKRIEIQIRTEKMHHIAEYGIASHWLYKHRGPKGRPQEKDLAIISKLKKWNGMRITSEGFLEEIKQEILQDSIYVFTPQGDVKELPRGSTAIDFAYHIHTEVGNRCIGAKADGNIIPLSRELKNTQVIEVLTSSKGRPRLDWLRYAKTSSARSKIRQWLNKHDDSLYLSKNLVVKKQKEEEKEEKPPLPSDANGKELIKRVIDNSKVVFKIGDEKNMMIGIANCCSPATGDNIIGYVSRGRGIIVHKKNCPNLAHIKDFEERSVEVEWETVSPRSTSRFRVKAKRTSDLFSEIEGAVRKYKGHLIEGKLEEEEGGCLRGAFTMELENKEDYKKVLKSIRTIPSIMNIYPIPQNPTP